MLSLVGSLLIQLSLSSNRSGIPNVSEVVLLWEYLFCNIERLYILWHIVLRVLKLTPKQDKNINFYKKSMVCLIMQASSVSAVIVYT